MTDGLHYRFSGRLVTIELGGDHPAEEVIAVITAALTDPSAPDGALVLIDARGSTAVRRSPEVRRMADAVARLVVGVEHLAVVVASDVQFGLARMGSVTVSAAGTLTSVHRELESALQALGVQE